MIIKPLTAHGFGHIVNQIDVSSSDHAREIRRLIAKGRFVIIRNKEPVPPDAMAMLYRNIGMLGVQPKEVKSALPENRAFCRVRKDSMFQGDDKGELAWHCSMQGREIADQLVCMYMHENDCEGGDTGFTDGQTAFRDLDEETQQYWIKRKAIYPIYNMQKMTAEVMNNSYFKDVYYDIEEAKHFVDADGGKPGDRQSRFIDIVRRHPVDGRRGFFFPYETIKGIQGYSYDRAMQMKKVLVDHLLQEKYIYWHKWRRYDIILSDQVHSLHKRKPYVGKRELWRSGIMYR